MMEAIYIHEKYQFKDWVITLEDWYGTDLISAFAVQKVYSQKCQSINDLEFLKDQFDVFTFEPDGSDPFCMEANPKNKYEILDSLIIKISNHLNLSPFKTKIAIKLKNDSIKKPKSNLNSRGSLHRAWSLMVKERDKECKKCKSKENLEAHHIKSFKEFPDLRYDISNGVTFCNLCHKIHHKENGK